MGCASLPTLTLCSPHLASVSFPSASHRRDLRRQQAFAEALGHQEGGCRGRTARKSPLCPPASCPPGIATPGWLCLLPALKPPRVGGAGAQVQRSGLASLLRFDFAALVVLGPSTLLRSPWDPVSPGLGSPSPRAAAEKGLELGGWAAGEGGAGGGSGVPTPSISLFSPPSIFPSPDQPANVPLIPSALNTGGSLPDLTNLHFPSPLPTPLDPDETAYPSLSGGNSTSNLANTMTHLGISGSMGLGTGYDSPGEGWPQPAPLPPGRETPEPTSGVAGPAAKTHGAGAGEPRGGPRGGEPPAASARWGWGSWDTRPAPPAGIPVLAVAEISLSGHS